MTSTQNQDTPAEQDLLDEAVRGLLGEYHDHKCSCGTGCINCRQTGYNQTPCPVCDKDGIAFKNVREFKAAIQSHVDQQIAERVQAEVVKKLESLYHNQAFGKDCSFCTANSYTMLDNIRQLAALSKEQPSEGNDV